MGSLKTHEIKERLSPALVDLFIVITTQALCTSSSLETYYIVAVWGNQGPASALPTEPAKADIVAQAGLWEGAEEFSEAGGGTR